MTSSLASLPATPARQPARDDVLIGIASIPERVSSLERVLDALAPQAGRVCVSLNGYRHLSSRITRKHPNVEITFRNVNGGDAEKFAAADDWDGYVLTCDDDILYPADYVETVCDAIDRYDRRALVSFHGGLTLGWNGAHIAATHRQVRCLGSLDRDDTTVNVLGTGTLGWHTAGVPVWRDAFRHVNMADVHLACHARELGIPMVALAHEQGWLRDICPPGPSIYASNRTGDRSPRDTRTARRAELDRFDWHYAQRERPRVRVSIATCGRPGKLDELLDDLEREAQWCDLEVCVYQDTAGPPADYRAVRARVERTGWAWRKSPRPLGKAGHWQLVDAEFADASRSRAEWFVFLPDDVRLVRHAIPRALVNWGLLDEPSTLTLWRLRSLEGKPNWTGCSPVVGDHGTEIFHVDGLYVCRRETLEQLAFRCGRTRTRGDLGSGVGRMLSRRLHAAGRRMYRVERSLAISNDDGVSIMNPVERELNPAVAL